MDRLLVDGSVNAAEFGNGRPLVLFHSLLSDRASFDRIGPELANSFRVIVLELPGFGRSHAVEGDLAAIADRMAAATREVAHGDKPVVLGNGYGAFVALQMVIRHPELAARLVLADGGAAFSEPGRAAFRNMAAAAAGKGLEAITEVAMRRLFAPEFQQANPELMANRRAAFLRTNPDVFRAACTALAGLDLRSELPKVRIPVLVLVGEQDEATPVDMARELAAGLLDARLVILKGCAHVPQLQAPTEFLAAARELMTGLKCELIISVPNAFRLDNLIGLFRGVENVHPDHNYYFSYHTATNLLKKSGMTVKEVYLYSFERKRVLSRWLRPRRNREGPPPAGETSGNDGPRPPKGGQSLQHTILAFLLFRFSPFCLARREYAKTVPPPRPAPSPASPKKPTVVVRKRRRVPDNS